MKFIKFLLLIEIILFSSCQKHNYFQFESDDLKKNLIQIDVPEEKTDLSNKIHKIDFIPLESNTDFIIGNISKIIVYDQFIFVYDKITKSALCFNNQGNFLNKFSKEGRGPAEYMQIKDINVNTFDNSFEIYDRATQKILSFNFSGEFIKERNTGRYFDSFISIDKDRYIFQIASDNPENFNFLLEENKKITNCFIKTKGLDNTNLKNQMTLNNNQVFLSHGGSNFIYKYEKNSLTPVYYINFGKRNLPEDILNKQELGMNDFFNLFVKNYSMYISNFYEDEKYITFCYINNKDPYWTIYNKNNRNIVTGNLKLYGLDIMPPILKVDSTFYTFIDPHYYLKKVTNESKNKNLLNEEFFKLTKNINETDLNPILLKFRLK